LSLAISFSKRTIDFVLLSSNTSSTDEEKIEKLRAAEKFIEIDEGKFECQGCGYIYDPVKGDKFAGIDPGIQFSELPDSFNCPACRSSKNQFKSIFK